MANEFFALPRPALGISGHVVSKQSLKKLFYIILFLNKAHRKIH